MKGTLPTVIRAGHFSSKKYMPDIVRTTPRILKCYELEMFSEDGGETFLNGNGYKVKKGCVLLARPGELRQSILHVRCYYIHFIAEDSEIIKLLNALPQFFQIENYTHAETLFQSVRSAFYAADPFAPMAADCRLGDLLWQLRVNSTPAGMVGTKDPIRSAVRTIQREFRQPLSVEQLAASCNLSVSHFHKLFVERMGTTPNRYLMLTRMAAAKAMLQSSNQSVAQVAECCGFSSQGYFCDCMKKFTGMSPREFRSCANYPEENT